MFGVQLLDFRGDKVIRERIYVPRAGGAGWRAKWLSATPSEPPADGASVSRPHSFAAGRAGSVIASETRSAGLSEVGAP